MRNYLIFRMILLTITLFSSLFAAAQTFGKSKETAMTADQKVFLTTVDSAIWVIRVDYVLEEVTASPSKKKDKNPDDDPDDKPKKDKKSKDEEGPKQFGKDDKDYFGRGHGMAVLSDNHLWFDRRLLQPWKYSDSASYELVKDESKYKPVVSNIWIRTMNSIDGKIEDKKFERCSFDLKSIAASEANLYRLPYKDEAFFGLAAQTPTAADTSGFMVLIAHTNKDKDIEADDATFGLSVPSARINFDRQGKGSYKQPVTSILRGGSKAFSGAYFILSPSFGRVECRFAGIFSPRKGSELELLPMATIPFPAPSVDAPPKKPVVTERKNDKLTPKGGEEDKKGGKNKKKEADKGGD